MHFDMGPCRFKCISKSDSQPTDPYFGSSLCGRSWVRTTAYWIATEKKESHQQFYVLNFSFVFYESIKLQVWNHVMIKTNRYAWAMERGKGRLRSSTFISKRSHCDVSHSIPDALWRSFSSRHYFIVPNTRPFIFNLYLILNYSRGDLMPNT